MIYILNFLILIVLSIFSLSFFPSLGISASSPLLPLFFIIALSYFRKGFEPIILAAIFGMVFDYFSPYPFGFYIFLFLISVVIVRTMFQEGMKELDFINYIIWSLILSVVYVGVQIIFLFSDKVEISFGIIQPTLMSIITNVLFSFFLYFGIVWYFDRIKVVENVIKSR